MIGHEREGLSCAVVAHVLVRDVDGGLGGGGACQGDLGCGALQNLQVDQQGVFVLIVDADKKAQIRRIETGASTGAGTVVSSGLKEGELVITDGVQKVRPGQVVNATPAQAAEAAQGDSGK